MSLPIVGRAAQIRSTEIINVQTPPLLHDGPSEKEMKYDRQLRLWAKTGQAALESANILLLNSGCGAVGVETLKNLILPGIGRFTIFDDRTVQEPDLGVNFFLDEDCLGKSRAKCCTELLMEMNPDVHGDWFPKSLVGGRFSCPFFSLTKILPTVKDIRSFANLPLLWKKQNDRLNHVLNTSPLFTMIISTFPARAEHVALLENYGRVHKTPIIMAHSAGFYSYFRIDLQGAFPIVDTHPDATATTDLRLLTPWPELLDFAREMTRDIDTMDSHKHGHIPYVAILLHYLDIWRENHSGEYPKTYKEKTEFRQLVESGMRKEAGGGEENWEEAIGAVLKTVVSPSLPNSLREVFDYQPMDPVSLAQSLDLSRLPGFVRNTLFPIKSQLPLFHLFPRFLKSLWL